MIPRRITSRQLADSIRKIIDDPAASEDVAQLVGAAMGDEPTGHVEAEPIRPGEDDEC